MSARFDRDDVRAALRARDVLERYGWRHHRIGRWYRSIACPACGGGDSDAFAVSDGGGKHTPGFRCHRCKRRGDLISLVGLFEGLDARREFLRVLEVAAGIAGVPPRERDWTAEERLAREAERLRRRAEDERRRAEEERALFEHGASVCPAIWDGLKRRNRPGESYLVERGLAELVGRDDLVRFGDRGEVRIPLYDVAGRMVNIAKRHLPGREPRNKLTGKPIRFGLVDGCPGHGCTYGSPDDVAHRDAGPIMLVEGFFDYLSAIVLWPDRACLGARQASDLSDVARLVADRIRYTDRDLVLVPHHDAHGLAAAHHACAAAVAAGLPRDRIRALDVSAAGDLNDWLTTRCAGGGGLKTCQSDIVT